VAARRAWRVESLDYPFAIAGVPRLVSGAEAGSAPVPCLLITQSAGFSDHHACRYRRRCGACGSQGVPAYCGMHSSRFDFFPREAPNALPSGRIRSPLLYRLSYPVSWALSTLSLQARFVQIPEETRRRSPFPLILTFRAGRMPRERRAHCLKILRRSYLYQARAASSQPDAGGMLKNYLTFASRFL
jgi:hypothetical protein